jgi:hypothetical protein
LKGGEADFSTALLTKAGATLIEMRVRGWVALFETALHFERFGAS